MRALALGDEGAWLEESTADGSIVAQLAAQSEGLREALGDFRAAAAELPGEVLAQSSVVAAAQVTQDVGEVSHEHALLGVSSHPGDQVLYTDNGALLGNGNDATEALPLTNAGVIQTPGMSNTVLDQQPEIGRRQYLVNPLLRRSQLL